MILIPFFINRDHALIRVNVIKKLFLTKLSSIKFERTSNNANLFKLINSKLATFLCINKFLILASQCDDKGNSTLNWFQYGQKCYYINTAGFTWQSAERFCNQNGGFLISIHSVNELKFFSTIVR